MAYRFPIIRIELDHMRQSIVHALSEYSTQMTEYVNGELQRIVDSFDYDAVVREVANEAISRSIKDEIDAYFRFGEGRKQINKLVEESFLRNRGAG